MIMTTYIFSYDTPMVRFMAFMSLMNSTEENLSVVLKYAA